MLSSVRLSLHTSGFGAVRAFSSRLRYVTKDNIIIKLESEDDTTVALSLTLGETAVDTIGDPIEVSSARPGTLAAQGAAVASVKWEGFLRTASDELYHAVWANAQGKYDIKLPFAARVTQLHSPVPGDLLLPQEERPWLVEVAVERRLWTASLESGAVAPVL